MKYGIPEYGERTYAMHPDSLREFRARRRAERASRMQGRARRRSYLLRHRA